MIKIRYYILIVCHCFLLSVFFVSCDEDSKSKDHSKNKYEFGLEDGPWKIYDDSLGQIYSEGTFDKGSKVNKWIYRSPSGDSVVRYKRNAVKAGPFRLGVPIAWQEVESPQFDFVAYLKASDTIRVIVNEIEAPESQITLSSFTRIAISGVLDSEEYRDIECSLRLVQLDNSDSIAVGQLTFTDVVLQKRMTQRLMYKKVADKIFIDSSVLGAKEDEATIASTFNDFLSNVIYKDHKLRPSSSEITNVKVIPCT